MAFDSFAQIANSSIFSEMKSVNPAVVSGRKQGQFTLLASMDELKRNQDISKSFGEGANIVSETEVQQFSLFRGGKGGGLTIEYNLKMVNGDVVNKLKSSVDELESKSDASSIYAGALLGLTDSFGIGVAYAKFDRKYSDKFSFGGQSINIDTIVDYTFISLKPGFRFGSSAFRVGLFAEYISQSGSIKTVDPFTGPIESSDFSPVIVIGTGIGMNVGGFNIELGYEGFPFMEEEKPDPRAADQTVPPKPSRVTFLIEGKISKFTVGYKGTLNSGLFVDLDNILSSQLFYPNPPESRLEHTINFAIGSDKGLAIGGSAYVSSIKSEEGSVVFNDGKSYATQTDSLGLSFKLGYVW